MNSAEKDKIELSYQDDIMIFIDEASIEVSRKEFELSIKYLVQQSMMAVEAAFDSTEYTVDDLQGVILAGGSTRIPYVQSELKKLVKLDPEMHDNPDETIALGAAIYATKKHADNLNPNQRAAVQDLDLEEVANKYYGTFAVDFNSGSGKVNSILIEKDTKIPCTVTREYQTLHDGQRLLIAKLQNVLFMNLLQNLFTFNGREL